MNGKRIALVLLCALLLTAACAASAEESALWYVYENPCTSCHPYEHFVDRLGEATQALGLGPIAATAVYLPGEEGRATFAALCERYGLDPNASLPMVVTPGGCLCGEAAINSDLELLLLTDFTFADALYFYRDTCPDCQNVQEELAVAAKQLRLARLSTDTPAYKALIYQLFDRFALADEQREIPFIYTADGCFAGEAAVRAWCEELGL